MLSFLVLVFDIVSLVVGVRSTYDKGPEARWQHPQDFIGDSFKLEEVTNENHFAVLDRMVQVRDTSQLNQGRDTRDYRHHANLKLLAAWKVIRNDGFFSEEFQTERQKMRAEAEGTEAKAFGPLLGGGTMFEAEQKELQQFGEFFSDPINEKLLLHGTRAEYVIPILNSKLDLTEDRLRNSSGMLGWGNYMADAIEKVNQYMTRDRTHLLPGEAYLSRELGVHNIPTHCQTSRFSLPRFCPRRRPAQNQSENVTDVADVFYALGVRALLGRSMALVMKSYDDEAKYYSPKQVMATNPEGTDANKSDVEVFQQAVLVRHDSPRFGKFHKVCTQLRGENAVTQERGAMSKVMDFLGGGLRRSRTGFIREDKPDEFYHSTRLMSQTDMKSVGRGVWWYRTRKFRYREYVVPYWSHRVEPEYVFAFARCEDELCNKFTGRPPMGN
eukprot:TRINITY_DN64254_c0_g1_i1.p1 TRINITY_DN64254_c0_g1~~TRINITY_DN64254_c0_g1_i1.p1  ORF type:complete len:441 (+),score=30.36 TRINITY_DN64254_c0_g1_i1:51-1373(+)